MQGESSTIQIAYQVLLFYKYITLEKPDEVAARVREIAESLGLTGRVIVAAEGINATLEGPVEKTEHFATMILQDQRFSGTADRYQHQRSRSRCRITWPRKKGSLELSRSKKNRC